MGYLYALFSALLFGINGSVAKLIIEAGISPAQLTFFRSAGAAVLCALVLLVVDRSAFRPSWKALAAFAVLGIVGVAAVQWLYASAISLLPVGIALLIEYLGVPLVALVALLVFHEPIRRRLWAGIVLMLAGLAVVAQIWDTRLDLLGMVIALGAAVALAVYFIVGERGVRASSPLMVGFWSMGTAAVFWAVFGNWWTIAPSVVTSTATIAGLAAPIWALLVWTVALGSFLPFVLSYLALKHLGATRGGILASAEVVFAFAAAWLLLGEALTITQIVGAVAVVAGIVLAQTARRGRIVDAELVPPLSTQPR